LYCGEVGYLANCDLFGEKDFGEVYGEGLPLSLPSKNEGRNCEFETLLSNTEALCEVFGDPSVIGSIENRSYEENREQNTGF